MRCVTEEKHAKTSRTTIPFFFAAQFVRCVLISIVDQIELS